MFDTTRKLREVMEGLYRWTSQRSILRLYGVVADLFVVFAPVPQPPRILYRSDKDC